MDEVPLDELLAQRRKPAAHRHPTRQHHDAVPLAERDRGESQRADIRRERRLPPYLTEYGLVRVRVRVTVRFRLELGLGLPPYLAEYRLRDVLALCVRVGCGTLGLVLAHGVSARVDPASVGGLEEHAPG